MAEHLDIFESLKERGLITRAQLLTALDYQKTTGGELGEILVKLGFVGESDLSRAMADAAGMKLVDLRQEAIDHGAMAKVPRTIIEKHLVVPIRHGQEEGKIVLAMADPSDLEAIQEVQFLTNQPVEAVLAAKSAIERAILHHYNLVSEDGKPVSVEDLLRMLLGKTPEAIVASLLMALVRKGFISLSEFRDELERLR